LAVATRPIGCQTEWASWDPTTHESSAQERNLMMNVAFLGDGTYNQESTPCGTEQSDEGFILPDLHANDSTAVSPEKVAAWVYLLRTTTQEKRLARAPPAGRIMQARAGVST